MARPNVYDWPTLDPLILELYRAPGRPGARLAAFRAAHGMSRRAVERRRQHLQRTGALPGRAQQPWTAAELATLAGAYAHTPPDALAARLGRPVRGVLIAGSRAGLSRDHGYSLADLARAIGCSPPQIRTWQRYGWLPTPRVSRAPVGSPGTRYGFTDRQLHAFLCDHGPAWQRYPCPGRDWLLALVHAPDLRRPQDPAPPPRVRAARPAVPAGIVEYSGPRQSHQAWR